MRNAMIILFCALQIANAGCATIVHGDKQEIRVETNPPGANVTIVGRRSQSMVSPAELVLRRKHDYELEIKKEGYRTEYVQVEQHLGGWFWCNLLFGGIIGIVVDISKGSAYNLEPKEIHVTLEPERAKG